MLTPSIWIDLNGDDLRCDPLEVRKATLASTLAKAGPGIRFNEHLECDDGETVFHHACKIGLEGIVAKRKDSRYRSGPSSDSPQTHPSRPHSSSASRCTAAQARFFVLSHALAAQNLILSSAGSHAREDWRRIIERKSADASDRLRSSDAGKKSPAEAGLNFG